MARKKGRSPRSTERAQPTSAKQRWLLVALLTVGVAALLLAVVTLTRGRNDDGGAISDLLGANDPGPVHVHGLGINPADKALFIATHTGLYRVAPDEAEAARVGDGRQDTMGFTVAGADRFLGSGHPDPQAMREPDLPPNLGLIESTDGGRSWTPVSLLGEADFHVLRSRRNRVYGFDSTNGRLLVSPDGGRTWSRRPIPGALIDLAVHPQKASRVVAVTERGLIASVDGGRSWRTHGGKVGLLAWPNHAQLLLVDGAGQVHASHDAGESWRAVGTIGGQPAAFHAQTAKELYVALHDGTVKRSADGGRSWAVRSAP